MPKFANDSLVSQEVTGILIKIVQFGRKYGMNTLIKKLEQSDLEGSNNQRILNFILDKIEEYYEVTRKDLTSNKRGKVLDARNTCILLLYEHLPLSSAAVMKHFNRNKSGFFKISNEFKGMRKNPVTQEEKEFVSIYTSIDKDVLNFKDSLKKAKSKN